ncbi:MAG: HpcH/HpaI aldolase/citrate lyase family protein [Rhodospirillaceae bacterium]
MKPLRTALFAPGIKDRVMAKALESGADAVILDLEDSVPVAAKTEARKLVGQTIAMAATRDKRPAIYVRTNSAATRVLDDDLDAVVQPGLDGIFLPKAETVDDVLQTAQIIERCETARGMSTQTVEIVLMIESALGVYRCYDMLTASPRVASACIGGARDGDLQTDLGCSWSIEGTELMYARSKVLLDTRAAGKLYPLDGVFSDLEDEAGLRQDSRLSARLGYVGRTVIHPKQIAPVREAYAVPEAEVAYYREVVAEFEAAEKKGEAAIVVAGKLVDYAMYARAKRVLALAELDR